MSPKALRVHFKIDEVLNTISSLAGKVTIYVHRSLDVDALLALASIRYYVRELRAAKIIFVDANWNGEMKPGDLAVDIYAGDRGLKGRLDEDGTQHSAFELIMRFFASEYELRLVKPLIDLIDAHDAKGDPFLHFYGREMDLELRMFLNETNVLMFYRALKSTGQEMSMEQNDRKLLKSFDDFFEGFRLNRIARSMEGRSALMPGVLDLDEGLAIAAFRMYNEVSKSSQPVFKDNTWTGRMTDGTVIIQDVDDLNNGCFLAQVMETAPEEEQALMVSLVRLMEAYIVCQRNPFEDLLKDTVYKKDFVMLDFLSSTSIVASFDGLRRSGELRGMKQRTSLNRQLADSARRIFKAFRKNRLKFLEVHEMVETNHEALTFLPSRKVVLVKNANNHRVNDVLFNEYGVRAVVIIDGDKLIIRRADGEHVRMDHKDILQVLFDAGELDEMKDATAYGRAMQNGKNGEWFLHMAGFIVANATNKAPDTQPSTVDPMVLAMVVEAVLLANPVLIAA